MYRPFQQPIFSTFLSWDPCMHVCFGAQLSVSRHIDHELVHAFHPVPYTCSDRFDSESSGQNLLNSPSSSNLPEASEKNKNHTYSTYMMRKRNANVFCVCHIKIHNIIYPQEAVYQFLCLIGRSDNTSPTDSKHPGEIGMPVLYRPRNPQKAL